MKIIKQEEHKLLERKRITAEVIHDKNKTPSKQEIVKELAQDLNVNPELINLRHIYTHFGATKSKVIANIYNNLAMLKSLEEFRKKKKDKKEKKQTKEKNAKEKS